MRAKIINEDLKDIMIPKTEAEVMAAADKFKAREVLEELNKRKGKMFCIYYNETSTVGINFFRDPYQTMVKYIKICNENLSYGFSLSLTIFEVNDIGGVIEDKDFYFRNKGDEVMQIWINDGNINIDISKS